MGTKKIDFFLQRSSKLNLTCAKELKSFKQVSTCTYMSTSGMHRRPFEGRHLVFVRMCLFLLTLDTINVSF